MNNKEFLEFVNLDLLSALKRAEKVLVIKRKTRTLIQLKNIDGSPLEL